MVDEEELQRTGKEVDRAEYGFRAQADRLRTCPVEAAAAVATAVVAAAPAPEGGAAVNVVVVTAAVAVVEGGGGELESVLAVARWVHPCSRWRFHWQPPWR